MTRTGFGVLALTLIGAAGVYGQNDAVVERVTFEEAVKQATARNPDVRQAAQAILRAEGLLQRGRSVFRPTLSAAVGTTVLDDARGFNGLVTQPRTQTAMSASFSYPILAASRWAAATQLADQVEVARIAAEDVRRQVAVATAQAYLAVIAERRRLEVAQRSADTARALSEYAHARLEGGLGSKLNDLRAAQELASSEVLLESARLALRRAQEALGVLLMSEAPVDAGGEPQLDVPPPGGDEWLTRRPDIRRLAAQYHAAARVVDDTWKDWLPEGTLLFQPEYVTPAGLFQPSKSWRAIAQLSVNLFDGGRGATRRIRIAERENARIALEGAQNRARSDLRAAQEAVASTDRAAQSARRAAESALEVVKITGVAFREGATTNIEVVQAQQTARTAEIAAAQADDSARQARLDLIVALGLFP